MSPPPDDITLAEARTWLAERLDVGVTCPCCRQQARQYVRKLNSGMALALIRMYAAGGTVWQDKTETLRGFGAAARDESLLRFWGLLEEDHRPRADGGRSGWWRVTEQGERFVRGWILVPSHVRLYANRFLGFEGSKVSIEDCLGEQFNLAQLLSESEFAAAQERVAGE